jgi:hypothetical protein
LDRLASSVALRGAAARRRARGPGYDRSPSEQVSNPGTVTMQAVIPADRNGVIERSVRLAMLQTTGRCSGLLLYRSSAALPSRACCSPAVRIPQGKQTANPRLSWAAVPPHIASTALLHFELQPLDGKLPHLCADLNVCRQHSPLAFSPEIIQSRQTSSTTRAAPLLTRAIYQCAIAAEASNLWA